MNKKTFALIKGEFEQLEVVEPEITIDDWVSNARNYMGNVIPEYRTRTTVSEEVFVIVQIGYNRQNRMEIPRRRVLEWSEDFIKYGSEDNFEYIPLDKIFTIRILKRKEVTKEEKLRSDVDE